jgi:hypothetical protein
VVGEIATAFVRFLWPGLVGSWRWFSQASPDERRDAFCGVDLDGNHNPQDSASSHRDCYELGRSRLQIIATA